MNSLNCPLCSEQFRTPKMCPNCSTIFCELCIRNYINHNPFCPGCDSYLIEIVDCTRLVNEVQSFLKQNSEGHSCCPLHHLPLKYECVDCKMLICSDCGMIQLVHKSHQLRLIGGVSEQEQAKCQTRIRRGLSRLKENIEKLELEKESLEAEVEGAKRLLREEHERLWDKIERQGDRMEKRIRTDLEKCVEVRAKFRELEGKSGSLCRQQIEQIEALTRQVMDYNGQAILSSPMTLSALEQIRPIPVRHTLTIPYDTTHHSFTINHFSWRLILNRSPTYLGVDIQLMEGGQSEYEMNCRLQLINMREIRNSVTRQFSGLFRTGSRKGVPEFMGLRELQEYAIQDELVWMVSIWGVSYYEECRILQYAQRKLQRRLKYFQRSSSSSSVIDSD